SKHGDINGFYTQYRFYSVVVMSANQSVALNLPNRRFYQFSQRLNRCNLIHWEICRQNMIQRSPCCFGNRQKIKWFATAQRHNTRSKQSTKSCATCSTVLDDSCT